VFDKFTEWWTSLGLVKVCGVWRMFITRWSYQTRNLFLKYINTFIYTSFYHYFSEIYVNFFVWIFSKCQFRTFSPASFRRWTGLPIHTKQNNHTMTKNIVLILYFVTVFCHIVNMSNMLNTVQHSNTIKVFLSINEEETKWLLNTQ